MATTDSNVVKYKGKVIMHLNSALIAAQKLTAKDVMIIKRIHARRYGLFLAMQKLDPTVRKDFLALRKAVKTLEDMEFKLQKAWKFPTDRNYHSWWFQAPHCKCPIMDNQDRVGTKYRVHTVGCPLHDKLKNVAPKSKKSLANQTQP